MPITIKGIRVDFVTLERSEESGNIDIKGAQYSLISSTDHVLAKQSIGGYGAMALKASPQTITAMKDFMEKYKTDVLAAIGMDLS